MKLWKRFALLALVAGMLGGTVLSGCGGSGDSDNSATDNAAPAKDKDKTPKDDGE